MQHALTAAQHRPTYVRAQARASRHARHYARNRGKKMSVQQLAMFVLCRDHLHINHRLRRQVIEIDGQHLCTSSALSPLQPLRKVSVTMCHVTKKVFRDVMSTTTVPRSHVIIIGTIMKFITLRSF